MKYEYDNFILNINEISNYLRVYLDNMKVNDILKKYAELKIIDVKKNIFIFLKKLDFIDLGRLSVDIGLEILYYDSKLEENINNNYYNKLYSLIIKYLINLQNYTNNRYIILLKNNF